MPFRNQTQLEKLQVEEFRKQKRKRKSNTWPSSEYTGYTWLSWLHFVCEIICVPKEHISSANKCNLANYSINHMGFTFTRERENPHVLAFRLNEVQFFFLRLNVSWLELIKYRPFRWICLCVSVGWVNWMSMRLEIFQSLCN